MTTIDRKSRAAGEGRAARLLTKTMTSAGAGLAAATMLAFAAPLAWWTDLFAHFRPHYAAGAVVLLAAALMRGRRKLAVVALGLAIANAAPLASLLQKETGVVSSASASAGKPAAKVVFLNVWEGNRDYERTFGFIERENPEVVVLVEVSSHWREALDRLRTRYPHHVENFGCTQYRFCHMAIYARRPWTAAGIEPSGSAVPLVWARFGEGPASLTVVGTHVLSGLHRPWSEKRRAQFDALAGFLRSAPGGVVLAGDINATPWSADFPRLIDAAALTHSGPVFAATWPTWLGPLGIPIDHVFAGRGAEVTDVRRGPSAGSDHYPILFRVAPAS